MTLLRDLIKLTDNYTERNESTIKVTQLQELISRYYVMGATFTVQDMSEYSALGVSTVRKYVKEFPELIVPTRGTHRKLLFSQNDLDNLVRIKSLFLKGYSPEKVARVLDTAYTPRDCDAARKSRNKKD